ncbi:hypothetical protein CKA32_000834 [Geitlerinema sp. FC II]|nr:hypothetical protein CKA32_000834 [Geitlerinema sp. FC II]
MCGESRTHGFEAEGKKATSGSTVTSPVTSHQSPVISEDREQSPVTSHQSPVKTGNGERGTVTSHQ